MLEKLEKYKVLNPQAIYGGRDHANNEGIPPDNTK
jgi:hypothetical protein